MSVLGNSTANSANWTRAQIYSQYVQDQLFPVLLNDDFVFNISDFGDGTTYNVPTVGEVTVRDRVEGQPSVYEQLDDGVFTMTINRFKEAANALTLEQMEDSYKAQYVRGALANKQVHGLMKVYISDILNTQDAQTASDPNLYGANGGADHRFVAENADDHLSQTDVNYASYALTQCDIPVQGRIGIVHPSVLLDITDNSNLLNLMNNFDFAGIVRTGFQANETMALYDIAGFKIMVSNLLPAISASETITHKGSSDTVASGAVANLFMSIASDDVKPIARAWRRRPKLASDYDFDTDQFKFKCTGRWGRGLILPQGLVTVLGVVN